MSSLHTFAQIRHFLTPGFAYFFPLLTNSVLLNVAVKAFLCDSRGHNVILSMPNLSK
jgi:hypothetical protein